MICHWVKMTQTFLKDKIEVARYQKIVIQNYHTYT